MKRNSLIDTNPYLKNPKQRTKLIRRSVETSSAIEGIKVKLGIIKKARKRSRSNG